MGKKRNRKHSKIDMLDPKVKSTVESMITANYTYKEIVEYIKDCTGEMISQAAVCRYAQGLCESLESIRYAQETFRAVNDEINRTPDMDTTEGMIRILSHIMLTNVQQLSDEDFKKVDPMKLLKQSSELIRVAAYKRNLDLKNKDITEMGFDAVKEKVFNAIAKKYPEDYARLSSILNELAAEASKEGGDGS